MRPDLFGPRPRHDPAVLERIKGWAAEALGLPEGTAGMVTELRCAEEGCPDVETVVAVPDGDGPPRQFRAFKPLAAVSRDDLAAAFGVCDGPTTKG
jgi:hypothetical protein